MKFILSSRFAKRTLSRRNIQKFFSFLLIISFSLPVSVVGQETPTQPLVIQEDISTPEIPSLPEPIIPLLDVFGENDSELPESEILENPILDETENGSNSVEEQNTDLHLEELDEEQEEIIDEEPPVESMSSSNPGSGDLHADDDRKAIASQTFFEPDAIAGSLNYSYPINLPKGRGKLTPDLSLLYSSQPGSNTNIVGYGWSLSVPYIERLNRTGVDDIYNQDYFYSYFDGELASTTSGLYGPLVENGNFLKYSFSTSTNIWIVTDKDGTTYKFGTTTLSRQDNPSDSTKIYKWMLDEIRDTNNNYIKYVYDKDKGQIYPSKIVYTGNASTDGIFEVNFLRESRSDINSSNETGFVATSTYRINEINIKVNGTWTKKYSLAYTTGDNATRSLLSTITEQGQDELSQTITLPATSFSYERSTPSWTIASTTTWDAPLWLSDYSNGTYGENGVRVVDINGDGLQDIVRSVVFPNSSSATSTYINNGNGWTQDYTWDIPVVFLDMRYSNNDYGARIVDINGDGLPDILRSVVLPNSSSVSTVYMNTGTGWTLDASYPEIPVVFLDQRYGNDDYGVRIMDVNGDGLPDLLRSVVLANSSTATSTYINNGHGWTQDFNWDTPLPFLDQRVNDDYGTRVADINGDGLPDLLRSIRITGGSTASSVYINNGHGWTLDDSWGTIPIIFTDQTTHTSDGSRIADINSDGLPDLIRSVVQPNSSTTSSVYINNGHTWVLNASWSVPFQFTNLVYNTEQGFQEIDLEGNNTLDFFRSTYFSSGATSTQTYLNNSKKVDLLTRVVNSTGGEATYGYKQTPQYSSGAGRSNPNLPLVLDTVNTISINDALGNRATTTYAYAGGNYYFNHSFDRKLAGFNKLVTTEPTGHVTNQYFHIGEGTDTSHGQYNDIKAKIGKQYRTENYDSSGNLFAKSINKWNDFDLGYSRKFIKAENTVASEYNGDSTHKDRAEKYTYENSYGNLIQTIRYGEVNGNDDGTFTDTGSDIASTTISYVASTTGYLVSLPHTEVTQDQSLNKVRETRHYYDNLSLGSVNAGNETKTEFWKSASTYASTTQIYNSLGLVTRNVDPRGNATDYTYDSYNLFVATSTNPVSHTRGYVYDYSAGKVKHLVDENSRVFINTYDALDRTKEVKQPDANTPVTLVTKTLYTYTDASTSPSIIRETSSLNSATSTDTYTYLDGLSRKIQTRKTAEGSNTYSVNDYKYSSLGLLSQESLPYFASSTSYATATTSPALYSNYLYDPLKRIVSSSNAVGTTTNTYVDWHTTVTDPRGKPKDFYKDAYDNLTSVVEHNSGAHSTTSYVYNLNKKLTSLTDGAGNVRNFTYDGLGNRLTAQDLHASADGTYGTWTYTYDNAKNLTQQVDPNSQTVNFTYDSLNRQLTEDYTGQAGTEVTYIYDGCGHGKGRMCVASSTSSRTSNIYNALGFVTEATTTIASIRYPTNFLYDRLGNQTFIKYPDDSRVGYIYNAAGYLDKVIRKELTDTASTTVVSRFDHAPTGQVSLIAYPNNATTTNTYNASALYRLSNKLTTLGSTTTIQQLAYTYDANGNITQLADTSNTNTAKTVVYTYDDLNRLISASTTSIASGTSYNQTYTYSMIGNLTYKSDVGAYSYAGTGYTNPHAPTSIALATSTYDNNGNLTQIVSANAPTWYQSTSTSAWSYKKPITIDHTKISGTSTLVNFPVLFSVTDTDLKYTSFGGKVGKTDGTDIYFTSSDGVTKLDHEIEKYASTTGEIASWIRIPSLSTTTDTVLYMFFGNSAATDQSNKTGVWSANYKAVYHLSGTSTVNALDSTSNTNNMNTTGSPTVQTGKIGGGVGVSSGNSLNKTINTTIGTTNTVSAWVYGSSFGNQNQSVNVTGGAELITAETPNSGKNTIYGGGFVLGSQLATSTWYYVVTTRNGTGTNTYKSYLNGNLDITTTRTSADSGAYLQIGTNGIKPWDGRVDEVRVSTTTNSADWIKTEYNNQSATSTFYSVGSVTSIGSSSWKYRKAITIDRSKVAGSGNLTNFPVLISTTHSDLKYTSSGGKVEKSDGTDILFTSSDATTKLDHEVEKYVSTSGELISWVKIPTLSPVSDTVIYMYFGNASSTDQQNVTGVWDSNYNAVWHLKDGTTLSLNDSSVQGKALTNYSASAIQGKIDGAASFNGSSNYFDRSSDVVTLNSGTFSMWIKPTFASNDGVSHYLFDTSTARHAFYKQASPNASIEMYNDGRRINFDVPAWSANTWHHVTFVYNKTGNIQALYWDGNSATVRVAGTGTWGSTALGSNFYVNARHSATEFFGGSTDEIRISSNNRTAEWVATEYNNQSATSTFYSISPLVTYSNYRATSTYTWDYRNQLTQVVGNHATSTHGYDAGGQRVLMTVGNTATYYPNKLYNIFGTTATKHIFAGADLIATIQGTSTSAVPYYIHTDHLGSTNVVTTASSTVTQLSDYYPYGGARLDQTSGSFAEQRKYIGEQYDPSSGLNYLNARYMDSTRGQFLSQDPVFRNIGSELEIQEKTGVNMTTLLSDPQQLNSYSYGRNNPIRYSDPTGNLSLDTLLNSPIESLKHVTGWGMFSLVGNAVNRPLSATLLRHSASLEPNNLDITSENQKQYGNVINSIKETSQYKDFINQAIENAKNGQAVTPGSFAFSKGDLYTALNRVKAEASVQDTKDGWTVNTTITDRYDFNPVKPETYKGTVTRLPAAQAYKDQGKGVLSNYDVKIKFSDKIKK